MTTTEKMPGAHHTGNQDITAGYSTGILVNATEMAKPFGKRPADWLRMSATKRLLQQLAALKNVAQGSLLKRVKQGKRHYLLLHEDAALEFARWLSPAFAIWSNQNTKAMLMSGQDAPALLPPEAAPLQVLAPLGELALFEETAQEQARKMEYIDSVLQSRTLITTTTIAKELGMSAVALNKLLHDKKVLYKSDNHWVLYADHCGKGYTGTKTAIFRDSAGNYQSSIHTYWTEKGRAFIHELLKAEEQAA